MTQKIYEIKDKLLDEIKKDVDSGNVNIGELGIMADVIKDLAEAEHHCWEAVYYKTVVEAMEGGELERMGYYGPDGSGVGSNAPQRSGYSGMMGYQGQGGGGGRSGGGGSRSGYSSRMGATGSMGGRGGYADPSIENIKQMLETADPMRKEQLKQDMRKLMMEVDI